MDTDTPLEQEKDIPPVELQKPFDRAYIGPDGAVVSRKVGATVSLDIAPQPQQSEIMQATVTLTVPRLATIDLQNLSFHLGIASEALKVSIFEGTLYPPASETADSSADANFTLTRSINGSAPIEYTIKQAQTEYPELSLKLKAARTSGEKFILIAVEATDGTTPIKGGIQFEIIFDCGPVPVADPIPLTAALLETDADGVFTSHTETVTSEVEEIVTQPNQIYLPSIQN